MSQSQQQQFAFTLAPNGLIDKLLTPCHACKAYNPEITPNGEPIKNFVALWDTGATLSAISKNVADVLGLTPFKTGLSYHAGGVCPTNFYKINILLPNGVGFHTRTVMEAVLKNCDMLIGMDIISQGDFALTNRDGKTVFSFQIPSTHLYDFVKQQAATQAKSKPKKKR